MRIRVAKWGNSLAVRLPRAVVEALGTKLGSELELTLLDGKAELRPCPVVPRYKLEDLVAQARRLGPENQPPYQDWGILPSEWPEEDWSDIAPADAAEQPSHAGAKRPRS